MSSPPEEDNFWKKYSDFYTASTNTTSNVTGDYRMYEPQESFYKKLMPETHDYLHKIRNRSKRMMVEDAVYDFKWKKNPFKLRGSIEVGTFTNPEAVEEVKEETPEEDLQYFDPKDLDI